MRVLSSNNSEPIKNVGPQKEQQKESPSFKISEKLIKLFEIQIQSELSNHNLYMLFANYYNKKGLYKLADYYVFRAKEEYEHYEWIRKYLMDSNVCFSYLDVTTNKFEINDNNLPLIETVNKEIETTKGIYDLVKQANEDGDYLTTAFLHKDLVPEQTEELKLSYDAVNIANLSDDWLAIQDSIHNLYFSKNGK